MDLWHEIHNWRVAEAIARYSEAHLLSLGPALVMSDRLLDRIVHGAHDGKIKTVGELRKETRWEEVDEYGEAIINILCRHLPQAAIIDARTPFNDRTALTINVPDAVPSAISASRSGQVQRCSLCGQAGHNSAFFFSLFKDFSLIDVTSGRNAACPQKRMEMAAT